ncbi:hypothetical protein KDL44_08950 [bacterium]|nr:hypothetical protein [bacterium]
MSRSQLVSLIAAALLFCCSACSKEEVESSEYLEFLGSNWGIGVVLGSSPETVEATLGEANFEIAARNKLNTDLIWTPVETTAHELDDSQLRLTFTEGELTRLMCIRHVSEGKDDQVFEPPFMMKAAPGCTLGSLKSDFINHLGPASSERTDSLTWDYNALDGNRLRITAVFNLDDEKGTAVCNSLTVQTGKSQGDSLAEEKKKAPVI